MAPDQTMRSGCWLSPPWPRRRRQLVSMLRKTRHTTCHNACHNAEASEVGPPRKPRQQQTTPRQAGATAQPLLPVTQPLQAMLQAAMAWA